MSAGTGSTGVPKGVAVTHAGLAGFCAAQREAYAASAAARSAGRAFVTAPDAEHAQRALLLVGDVQERPVDHALHPERGAGDLQLIVRQVRSEAGLGLASGWLTTIFLSASM